MKIKLSILISVLVVSCAESGSPDFRPRDGEVNPSIIHVEFDEESAVSIDSLFTNPQFIRLETNEEVLIASYNKILLYDELIFILSNSFDQQAIFIFDTDGNFQLKIDERGRGPGEYEEINDFYIDTESREVGVLTFSRIIKYNFQGEYTGETIDLFEHRVLRIQYWNDKLYAYALALEEGGWRNDRTMSFAAFNNNGTLLYKDIPVSNSVLMYNLRKENYLTGSEDAVYFNHFASDTIYRATDTHLFPEFVLDYGPHTLPANVKEQFLSERFSSQVTDYFSRNDHVKFGPHSIYSTDRYLYLKVPIGHRLVSAIHLRDTGKTKVLQTITRRPERMSPSVKGSYGGRLVGVIDALQIHTANNRDMSSGEPGPDSEFHYANIDGYERINRDDNSIIVIYEVKDF